VLSRTAAEKLARLPGGDYEETDEQLEAFAANFESVRCWAFGGLCAEAVC
jgi:hypothetical protein